MRLFVAVNFPGELRQSIWDATTALRARDYPVKWVGPDALHLTLKFLGEVGSDREAEIVAALGAAVTGVRRFRMEVGGCGAFPNSRRPRVIWIGCEAPAALELMQQRVEQELHAIGFSLEGRPFRPHLTLGRVRRGARESQLRGMGSQLEELVVRGEAEIQAVDLMRSELTRAGARYTKLCGLPLEA